MNEVVTKGGWKCGRAGEWRIHSPLPTKMETSIYDDDDDDDNDDDEDDDDDDDEQRYSNKRIKTRHQAHSNTCPLNLKTQAMLPQIIH
jgi:hypothetical protein